jgi:CubicO group peptidase (beta-lactamase class C family)
VVSSARLAVLLDRVRLEVDSGALPSLQVAVAHEGRLVANETMGDATPETRYVLQSCGRTVVAAVAWKLIDDGLLNITNPVAHYIDGFAANGKESVTVEQVLTHTAGFPKAPLAFPDFLSRENRNAAFEKWRLTYEPGSRLEFHLTSAAWVIEELCFRLSGMSLRDYVRDQFSLPLGLASLEIGPAEDADHIAPFVTTDDPSEEVNPWGPWYLAPRDVLAGGEPSHSSVATAADLAMFYQALLGGELISRATVEDALRVRVTMPVEGERGGSRSVPGNVALYVVVVGDDGLQRAMLPTTGTPALFGHGGAPCQIAFADPGTGLSFAFLTNGYPASGYDLSRTAQNRIINIGNLAADLVP